MTLLIPFPAQPTPALALAFAKLAAEISGPPSALPADEYTEPEPCPPHGIVRPLRLVRGDQ